MAETPQTKPRRAITPSGKRHHGRQQNLNSRKRRRGAPQQLPRTPVAKPLCIVCSNEEKSPKYKCPKCRALYCSVECYKEHKLTCPGKPPEANEVASSPSWLVDVPSRRHIRQDDDEDSFDDEWNTDEMKRQLESSDWLHRQLQDGGLRELISQIVASGSVHALKQAQERFPHLKMFLDKMLVVAGVLEREVDPDDQLAAEETIEEWLERDWNNSTEQPVLSLKTFRRSMPVFQPVEASSSSESGEMSSSSEEESESDSSSGQDDSSTE